MIKKVGANSEKETWLNSNIQPFAGYLFDTISSLHVLVANDS
jgi:hypothetical protein